jgi:CxxC motif-containing protein (DUF1111 family)
MSEGENELMILKAISGLVLCLMCLDESAFPQAHDPGPRPGAASAGGPIAGLTPAQLNLFNEGASRFVEAEKVTDGLGPRMNLSSCSGCHAYPAIGGTGAKANPQYQFATGLDHGTNTLPSFITINGPTREVRFKKTNQGTPDGGVHDIFTIAGLKGVPSSCRIVQPDFSNKANIIYRIPTPTFGGGLIEQVRDSDILANIQKEVAAKNQMQIKGKVNVVISGNTHTQQSRIMGDTNNNGNDGTIARFGWKAQNKSLLIFAGEAYNVEMGISNELFQTEREETCILSTPVTTPNDSTNAPDPSHPLAILSDIEVFAAFMRFLAPPTPSATVPGGAPSITRGNVLFSQVGCNLCHTPSLNTDPHSTVAALAGKPVNLFSDLAVHRMGKNLEDGISQGEAEGDEFRTAPLWGLGQRLFFLHDGRTTDLVTAIEEHKGDKSEANEVIKKYDHLHTQDKQHLLNFLRSL